MKLLNWTSFCIPFVFALQLSSASRERSPFVERFRTLADQYLATLDTRLTEFGTSLTCIIVAYQVMVLHDESTPFLSSALTILHLPLDGWAFMLAFVGFGQFAGFILGAEDNKFARVRANFAGAASLAWFFAVVAIATTVPFVFAPILRYALSVIVNGIMFLSLSARYRHSVVWNDTDNGTSKS